MYGALGIRTLTIRLNQENPRGIVAHLRNSRATNPTTDGRMTPGKLLAVLAEDLAHVMHRPGTRRDLGVVDVLQREENLR